MSYKSLIRLSAITAFVTLALSACGGHHHHNNNHDPEPQPDPEPEVNRVVQISQLATDGNAAQLNTLGCYDQKADKNKCSIVMYQVIAGVYENGGDGAGWGYGWGPSHYLGTIGGVTKALDYIKDLGANALWMGPIFYTEPYDLHPYGIDQKTRASGYYPSTHIKIDEKIGTDESFRDFITAAHDRGMQVILDGIFGHAQDGFVQPEQIAAQLPELTSKNYGPDGSVGVWADHNMFFDWGQENAENLVLTENYFKELAAYMITEYHIDGWRYDQAYQVPPASWGHIQESINQAAAQMNVSGYTVGELMDGSGNMIKKWGFEGGMDSAFNFPVRYAFTKVIASDEDKKGERKDPAELRGLPATEIETYGFATMASSAVAGKMYNSFLENHDLVRLGDLIQYAGYVPDGENDTVLANEEYRKRQKLSYMFLTQMSGPISIMYNQEIGDQVPYFTIEKDNCGTADYFFCNDHVSRTDAVSSEEALSEDQKELRDYMKELLRIRSEHQALWYGSRFHLFSDKETYIDLKINSESKDIVVFIMNTGKTNAEISITADVIQQLCNNTGALCTDEIQLENLLDPEDRPVVSEETVITVDGLSGKLYQVIL